MKIHTLILCLLLTLSACKFNDNKPAENPVFSMPKVEFKEPSKIEMKILKREETEFSYTLSLLFKMSDSSEPEGHFMFDLYYWVSEKDNPDNILEQFKFKETMGESDQWYFDGTDLYMTKVVFIDKTNLNSEDNLYHLKVQLDRKEKQFQFEKELNLDKKILEEEKFSESGAVSPKARELFEKMKSEGKFLGVYEPKIETFKNTIDIYYELLVFPKGDINKYEIGNSGIDIYTILIKDGKIRSRQSYKSAQYDKSRSHKFWVQIPYMDIIAPPGTNTYEYEIFAKLKNGEKEILASGAIEFEQPQFYGFSFTAKDIDVDVSNMDIPVPGAVIFNRNKGQGKGDLFIEFRDGPERKKSKRRFAGKVQKNSGILKMEKGSFQFYPDKNINIYFNDNDVIGHDVMEVFEVSPLDIGTHQIDISGGRVKNCKLEYEIEKITKENFENYSFPGE